MIYVTGHKYPDTDSTIAAIAEAEFLRQRGIDAEPIIQGPVTPETQWVLDRFDLNTPEIMTSVAGKTIALVDTSEPSQLPDDINEARIESIVDHHNLGGIKTAGTLHITIRPWGSTCTIIANQFKEKDFGIPARLAGAMACAILSDTVMFKSPTTHGNDRSAVRKLSIIADIDSKEVGMDMWRAKSNIDNDSVDALLNRDSKDFICNGKQMRVAAIEMIDIGPIEKRLPEIKAAMEKIHQEGKNILLLIVDIMKEGALMISYTENDKKIEKMFMGDWQDHMAFIPGIISRKKQVIPILNRSF